MASPPRHGTIVRVCIRKGGSEVLQWRPIVRLAVIVLVVLAFALAFGWVDFLEW